MQAVPQLDNALFTQQAFWSKQLLGTAQILAGEKRFTAEEARAIYPQLKFLPRTQWGSAPCLCGKKCDLACYRHLTGKEI